jgi:hypothetical protein
MFVSHQPVQARPGVIRRWIAGLLLGLMITLLVLNPLWECHDRLDNLRHLGPHGFLVMFLLFACAGITLFQAIRWGRPGGSQLMPLHLNILASDARGLSHPVCSFVSADLVLPLRI